MKLQEIVKDYLEEEPKFRERRNKDRGIVNLLMRRYPKLKFVIETGAISKKEIIEIVQDHASMDRYWRKHTLENKSLRGFDYDDKKICEQEKQIELGYEPGYHRDTSRTTQTKLGIR